MSKKLRLNQHSFLIISLFAVCGFLIALGLFIKKNGFSQYTRNTPIPQASVPFADTGSVSLEEILNNSLKYLNKTIVITKVGVEKAALTTCTAVACSKENECCNSCSTWIEITQMSTKSAEKRSLKILSPIDKNFGCFGNECGLTCRPLEVGNVYTVEATLRQASKNDGFLQTEDEELYLEYLSHQSL